METEDFPIRLSFWGGFVCHCLPIFQGKFAVGFGECRMFNHLGGQYDLKVWMILRLAVWMNLSRLQNPATVPKMLY